MRCIPVVLLAVAVMDGVTTTGSADVKYRLSEYDRNAGCVGDPKADVFLDPYICTYRCLDWERSCFISPMSDTVYEWFSTTNSHHDCRQGAGMIRIDNLTLGVCRQGALLEAVPRDSGSVKFWSSANCYNGNIPPESFEQFVPKSCVPLKSAASVVLAPSKDHANAFDFSMWAGDYGHTCSGNPYLTGSIPEIDRCLNLRDGSSLMVNQ